MRTGVRTAARRRRSLILCLAACVLAGLTLAISSRPASAAMTCSLAVADMAFGSLDVLAGAAVSSSTGATVSCSGASANTTYRFCVNARQGPDYSGGQRHMASGSDLLAFGLYTDSTHTTGFGNWTQPFLGGGLQVDFTSNGSGAITGAFTIYGAVLSSQQTAVPESYSENIGGSSNSNLQYGSTPASGSCPTGGTTATYGYNITGTVVNNCNVTGGTLNFGSTQTTITSSIDAAMNITAQCTNSTPYSIGLDNGTYANGAQRRMRLGATSNYVTYGLYTDSARSSGWSTTTSASSCSTGTGTCALGTGTGANQSVPVYGRVPSQTVPAIGSYSDTVLVTLTY